MPFVRHAGSVAVPEWEAPAHSAAQEWGGAEAMALGGGAGKGGNLKCVQRLWSLPLDGDLIHIPGEIDIGGG